MQKADSITFVLASVRRNWAGTRKTMHRERFFDAFLQAAGGARIQFHQLPMQSFQRTFGVGAFGHGVGIP
jgi:hypothetical protein